MEIGLFVERNAAELVGGWFSAAGRKQVGQTLRFWLV